MPGDVGAVGKLVGAGVGSIAPVLPSGVVDEPSSGSPVKGSIGGVVPPSPPSPVGVDVPLLSAGLRRTFWVRPAGIVACGSEPKMGSVRLPVCNCWICSNRSLVERPLAKMGGNSRLRSIAGCEFGTTPKGLGSANSGKPKIESDMMMPPSKSRRAT